MAGSQLKKLKESLREAGLTGQTNVKKKGKRHSQKTPNETRRDDRQKIVANIRAEFNTFDTKFNRSKRDTDTKVAVGRPSAAKSEAEQERKRTYEALKARKNKAGGVYDRRFGENDSSLTAEEKMLERFTRERLAQASKKSMYNLDDDENPYGDEGLTHSGKTLFGDLEEDEEEDDGGFLSKKRNFEDEEEQEPQPGRKKTKAEVMREIIAKSKFYKQERKIEKIRLEENIGELDEDFDDVMSELRGVPQDKPAQFSTKSEVDIKYDTAVRSLTLDRRAVPADRVKSAEELEAEHKAKLEKLEADRKRRMEGMDAPAEAQADDLQDDFWNGSEEEGEDEVRLASDEDVSNAEIDSEAEEEQDRPVSGTNNIKIGGKPAAIACPSSLEEFLELLEDLDESEYANVVKKVLKTYDPKFGEQNKAKCAAFGRALVDLVVYLTDNSATPVVIEALIARVKQLVERYPDDMYAKFRSLLETLSTKEEFAKSDLVVFTMIGMIYSTSDQYHLVATPATLLMCQYLETAEFKTNRNVFVGVYFASLLNEYQRLSKRFVPEVVCFIEKAFLALIPRPETLDTTKLATTHTKLTKTPLTLAKIQLPESDRLSLSLLDSRSKSVTQKLFAKLIGITSVLVPVWQQFASFPEISAPIIAILEHIQSEELKPVADLLQRLVKLRDVNLRERMPLKLQAHRSIALASTVPKYEENFNPDKTYDPDRERVEVNKLKAQLKKEQKAALREIRKDSRFIGQQQIEERQKEMEEYHAKMSKIVNSISTVEGAEKNQIEREKRKR